MSGRLPPHAGTGHHTDYTEPHPRDPEDDQCPVDAPPNPAACSRHLTALTLVATLAGSAFAAPGGNQKGGFKTTVPAMLMEGADAPDGVVIDPIISVGDRLNSGFVFDSIPDGISFTRSGSGRADLYVNHETSLVPFPGTLTDFTNSHVDRLVMNQQSGGILAGSDAIPSSANYQRFCSNFLAGPAEGFDRRILFTNEEATDVVNRQGLAWPAIPSVGSQPEQAGVVVALDIASGEYRTIYGMGRHNHENSVAIPGYDELVVLSGDDTFSAPASQVYSYIAPTRDAVWNDEGELWAFVGETGVSTTTATWRSATTSPATSSRFRARSRSATRPRSRRGRTRTTCSSSSGSRTSPTTATTRTSSTWPTPASPGPCRMRRPAGCGAAGQLARTDHSRTVGSSGSSSTPTTRPVSTACRS